MKTTRTEDIKTEPLGIVHGAVIATADHAQGRAVPVLIVDCQSRQDVADIFMLHASLGRLGDSRHTWLRGGGPTLEVFLRVDFLDPVETQVVIKFDLPQQATFIEMILKAECFYFQSGKPGDRMANTDGTPRILVETLSAGFEADWHRLHVDLLAPKYKGKGRSRAERIRLAEEEIASLAFMSQLRIPQV